MSSTTGADHLNGLAHGLANDLGQSLIEFLLMLPVVVGLTLVMARVNTAIQVSIVNQQYARAQATWLAFNSPVFPEIRLRVDNFLADGRESNQMILGVSANTPSDEDGSSDGKYVPQASTQKISRKGNGGSDESQIEPDREGRSNVRIRTTVAVCTQPNVIGTPEGGLAPILPVSIVGNRARRPAQIQVVAPYKLNDQSAFDFCRRPAI